jgi:hypothetical protein
VSTPLAAETGRYMPLRGHPRHFRMPTRQPQLSNPGLGWSGFDGVGLLDCHAAGTTRGQLRAAGEAGSASLLEKQRETTTVPMTITQDASRAARQFA